MRTLFLTLIIATTSLTAKADLLLDLEFTDSSHMKTVANGDVVLLNLILRDPSDDTFISLEGLGAGGGAIIQTAGLATLTPVAIGLDPGSAVEGPEFDFADRSGTLVTPRPGIVDSVGVLPPIFIPAGLGVTDVLLATFSVIATGADGDKAFLSADVLDPGHLFVGNETFTTFTDLDLLLTDLATTPGNFGSVELTIAAVPEPSTIFAGVLIAGGLVWRRRKTASA